MTEEEYFRKNYPNSCYGDKPLSPHWDFFQDGVEFGERQSEKRIAELEATNKTISNECHKLVNSLEKKQNEVAELKKQLRDKKCNDKDCPVFIKLIQANKENAELKDYRLTTLAKQQTDMSKYALNLEHKLSWYDDQLTKAKELLRMVIDSYNHKERFSFEKDLMKAEQFLNSEEEKGMTENSNVPECPSIKIGCDKMYYVDEVEK